VSATPWLGVSAVAGAIAGDAPRLIFAVLAVAALVTYELERRELERRAGR
jgi:hypothetical protein